ncbi:ATP-binding protein [Dyadobacter diqingensis]|uniref:ATP-binding protein n=1 Tax=Dyadobacter diqingensis TaxID=2938121 RepID=UPI0020C1AE15|nr:ATP-binding protein [Dyadobacter diqingensis]
MDKVVYSSRFNDIWKAEHDIKSQWGNRAFCIAHIIGYPATSLLYYLNNNPLFSKILQIQLLGSAVMIALMVFHFLNKLSSQRVAFYTFLTVIIFHAWILATIPHASYDRASFNMTLALIFITIVLRWPARESIICTILVFLLFPSALYWLQPEALGQFIKEGGFFLFLGQLLFPFIMHIKYTSDKRAFYYQYTLREKNELLEKHILITEEATRAKTDFLSMMSHEIRTPLNGIVGIVHLLLKEELRSDFQKEMIQTLLFSSNHLMTVVNDIMDFNKINSNHVKLDSSPFDPVLLFRNLEKTFIPKAREKRLELIFDIENSLPPQLLGDQGRLNQVITNLIHNAIKFTDKGSVTLKVSELTRNEQEIGLYFKISDTGIGIPADKQDSIFELFTQAHTSGDRQYGGSGLGLAITKEILRLFESEINLHSTADKGSEFSFEINFSYSSQPLNNGKQIVEAKQASYPDAKVLVVDDNYTNLLLATTLLKRKNISFETAENGQEALDKFKASEDYDLVLMDLRMPVMDGFESTILMRAEGYTVPIVALTASTFEDEKERALSNGFTGYLVKPFLPVDFYEMVYFHLDKKAVENE